MSGIKGITQRIVQLVLDLEPAQMIIDSAYDMKATV
jgi:hypothetical protein